MNVMYDITSVSETADGIKVEARFFEGCFEEVEKKTQDGNSYNQNEFVRKDHLYDIAKYFPPKTEKKEWIEWFTNFMSKDTDGRKPLWTTESLSETLSVE